MLVSGIQQSDSVIHIYIVFQIIFHYRLLLDIEYSCLCYTVAPCVYLFYFFFSSVQHLHCSFFFEFYFILFIFLYSRFLLVIYFIHIRVYMSIPISQFITPPPPLPAALPPWCPYICSLHLCLYFCPANQFICTIFLGPTYMR